MMSNHFVTRPVTHNTVDVFYGDGWENWARILYHKGAKVQIKGKHLPKAIFEKLPLQQGKK